MHTPPLPRVEILLLAAGASTRMRGTDKLLEEIDGETQIRRMAKAALSTGCPVLITLPKGSVTRAGAVSGLNAGLIWVENAMGGMAHSLRAGIAAVTPGAAAMIVLADLVEITADDLRRMLRAHHSQPERILQATSAQGLPGHPVLFPASVLPELAALTGDQGARAVLARNASRMAFVTLPEEHAITDLDTPEEWVAWRAAR
jgi:molybdenum cofactor cytidylyltransferase